MPVSYAVLFKTHFWNSYVERQFRRLTERIESGSVYICVDETSGPVEGINYPNVIRTTASEVIEIGLPDIKIGGNLFWYSIDYLHGWFFKRFPNYDYYLTVEYDAVIATNIDSLVDKVAESRIDYVGFPMRDPVPKWSWTEVHLPVYRVDVMRAYLSCIAIFSKKAMAFLLVRRLEMAKEFKEGKLAFWPYTEAFIPTELEMAAYRVGSLSDYGRTDAYDWWPPIHEDDLNALADEAFIHPVLEGDRYIASLFRHHRQLTSYFDPRSPLRRQLSRFPRADYAPHFRREFRRRLNDAVKRRLARVGIGETWAAGATAPRPKPRNASGGDQAC